jgi:hypothetical protein
MTIPQDGKPTHVTMAVLGSTDPAGLVKVGNRVKANGEIHGDRRNTHRKICISIMEYEYHKYKH